MHRNMMIMERITKQSSSQTQAYTEAIDWVGELHCPSIVLIIVFSSINMLSTIIYLIMHTNHKIEIQSIFILGVQGQKQGQVPLNVRNG